ncbi:MAG: ABC transporter permease, partial [Gammaproteobacteria bacterium]|nr:ABC transporter permease [Gammaproteobacteria bacterium]MBU1465513.1 ABC transporter permease [Gammaproteobacteria bacterium]MBU2316994.1 ABC transporter permease [Gammaproteobacteria bacterium]
MKMNKSQWVGLSILLALLAFSLLVVGFSPYSISQQDLNAIMESPSATHWLGTDHFGRSMLTRMAHAVGLSFVLSVLCVLTSSFVGTAFGVWAVWGGKKVDHVMGVMVNILLALPGLVVVLLFAAIAPGSFLVLYLAISLVQWVEYFRV